MVSSSSAQAACASRRATSTAAVVQRRASASPAWPASGPSPSHDELAAAGLPPLAQRPPPQRRRDEGQRAMISRDRGGDDVPDVDAGAGRRPAPAPSPGSLGSRPPAAPGRRRRGSGAGSRVLRLLGRGRAGRVGRPGGRHGALDRRRRGGVERHPAEALEVDLGPGVQVAVGQRVDTGARAAAAGEAERHPGRDTRPPAPSRPWPPRTARRSRSCWSGSPRSALPVRPVRWTGCTTNPFRC